ncbi:fimbrial protein [Kluyvera intermedia]|uniref:fimbrial protein n=1 Tax=Kluyvera intermedia TaxID=61648 RepID=UPI000786B743|nr:fimbrial protein [Kluyvera intermedia]WQD29278.1 fimbrial protein [Kluyvera intermedia]VDZ85077.1 Major MR/P fimbria protein precursor [Kluyvera intermedia]
MKLNKIASVFALAMGMTAMGVSAAEVVDQGHGSIKFTGTIIDAPCSINPESSNQEIDLGQIAAHSLDNEGRSSVQPFFIKLENCVLEEGKDATGKPLKNNTINITFNGAKVEGTELLGITGSASGAGVALGAATGEQIKLNTQTFVQDMSEGNNTLAFSAWLQGISGVSAVPGMFDAITDFTMQYE